MSDLNALLSLVNRSGLRLGILGERSDGKWTCTLYRGPHPDVAGAAFGEPSAEIAIVNAMQKAMPPAAPINLPPPPL